MRRLAGPVAVLSLLLAACQSTPAASAPAKSASRPAAASVVLGEYDETADAEADIRKALAAAAADGKLVLVDFGADWCPDCVVLTKLAAKPKVKPLLANYHVVSVDVGEFDRNLDVASALGLDLSASGIPALVVLDSEAKVRTVTNDGSFANAHSMSADDVVAFLSTWA